MARLGLRLVEYFVAVADELHFGRAAERLHIAQPSLSQQIRRLEDQLGVTLLERTSRRVELTAAGATLLAEGRQTLAQAQRVIALTRAPAAADRLTVGFFGSAAGTLLTDVLRAFGQTHPAVEVSVRELLLGSLDEILIGTVDVAFTRLMPGQTEAEVEILAGATTLPAHRRRLRAGHRCRPGGRLAGLAIGPRSPVGGGVYPDRARRRRGRASGLTGLRGLHSTRTAGCGSCPSRSATRSRSHPQPRAIFRERTAHSAPVGITISVRRRAGSEPADESNMQS